MAKIQIICPHCGQSLQCDESAQGKQIRCPPCGHIFQIPQKPQHAISQHALDNMKRVAKRLIDLESEKPGCVRLRANPFLRDSVAEKFKKMGFKKRLMQSAEQFNINCFLSSQPAAESVIHRVLLDASSDEQGRHHCWHGSGRYIGWEGLAQLADWTNQENCNFIFMINISPFFDRISDLLEHIKPVEALSSGNQNKQRAPISRQELATKLMLIVCDKDVNSAVKELNLSRQQKDRYFFSTLVLAFILPITLATLNSREDLIQILPDVFGVSWPENPWNKDEPERIGDFVIMENEHQRMGEFLETKYHQKVRIQDVPNYKVDFGTLVSAISMIRCTQQIADCKEIFRVYTGEKQHFALICQLGIRLESYICEDVTGTGSHQADQNNSARTAVFGRIAGAYFKKVYEIFKTL